ncbi:MAG: MBL fold metallo-hydrolase [Bacteroidota bacterium]|nr:MBL fold metallo-hydrolase [Bacteroidota bacterium]
MANITRILDGNIEGLFFVDETCIDCDTCRQLAPEVFTDLGDYSVVFHQPSSDSEVRNSTQALLACPTGSIGTTEKIDTHSVMEDFPLPLDDGIYYNGFTSKHSFGASSYFVKHPEGNWMIDSPKYMPHLVVKFEAMGGGRYIFLSHQDDVADADRYAKHFGAQRIIHRAELRAQPEAEVVIEGREPVRFNSDFLVIPTPGHTQGHCVLLYKGHYLFTGDHLWWSRNRKTLNASRSVCWYSWTEQTRSMELLLGYEFDWVLPGHGERITLPAATMKEHLLRLIERMHSNAK